jgi:hypothetical protein
VSDTYPVTYYCPRCGAVAELRRDGYLADRSVTPYPLAGWRYVDPDADYEADDADGVRLVCGTDAPPSLRFTGDHSDADDVAAPGTGPCGEPFYLSFVRYEAGERVDPRPEPESVELAGEGPRGPPGPDAFRG